MSWRFRKSFKVMPGVRLNLTARGLSATLGASPFSVNVGPRGVYSNVSIPGTGVWSRKRLDDSCSEQSTEEPTPIDTGNPPPPVTPGKPALTELHSASTELLTSETMEGFRKLLQEANEERRVLRGEIASAEREANFTDQRYLSWERGFLFKRLFKQAFAARKESSATAKEKLEELQEQLRLSTLATQIDIQREQAESYYKMRDEFAALSRCQRTWDTLARRTVNRAAERSLAGEEVSREPVCFSLNDSDLIQWEQKVPHLPNRSAGDLYLYPGFVLYRASKQAFAVIESRDVHVTFKPTRFLESEAIPSDAKVVGNTWVKCNKDGSPDRRFRDNHPVPIVLYGTLVFASSRGLHEEYLCSSPALAERFANAWNTVLASFEPGDPSYGGNAPPQAQGEGGGGKNPRSMRLNINLDQLSENSWRATVEEWPEENVVAPTRELAVAAITRRLEERTGGRAKEVNAPSGAGTPSP